MPVSDPKVVDGMGVDSVSGVLQMHMWEERAWDHPPEMLSELRSKTRGYLSFVTDGGLDDYPPFRGRQIEIQVFFQHRPPELAKVVFRELAAELSKSQISFSAFHGPTGESPRITY